MMSPSVKEIAKALSIAQGKMNQLKRDKQAYGYSYADLASCLSEVKPVLAESEIALVQLLQVDDNRVMMLETLLIHSSGEWLRSIFPIKAQASKQSNEMQALGSGITYIRRYAICSMLGLAQEDDDGASAMPKDYKAPEVKQINPLVVKLQALCTEYSVDIKDFTQRHKISSSNIESVKNAVENFDYLLDLYNNPESV